MANKSFERMPKSYDPKQVEAAWDAWWDEQKLSQPSMESSATSFVMVQPPANRTGSLHLGHALTVSIEDAIVRWRRMRGYNVLYVAGTDHAGIATQTVVEKKVMKEQGKTRHDLGREAFLEEVWKWSESSGRKIISQLRRLGISADWSRERFTMDDMCNRAVTEAFVRMYDDGVIYRANRMVSWSCALKTAISAIEVDHRQFDEPTTISVPGVPQPVEVGVMHTFAYEFENQALGYILVATTRIETIMGDVAVVVHPDDVRYKRFHGEKIKHPFDKTREMFLLCDAKLVDMGFGTGVVKLTPGHDQNDFDCAERLKLPFINIFDDDGKMNASGGPFAGQNRFEARENVIAQLKALGLYRGKKASKMSIGFCSRSKDVIENVVRPQWWVRCRNMARQAIQKVQSGELKIYPKGWDETWYRWLENIREWCISRQIVWGHRVPAYQVSIDGAEPLEDWIVARNAEEAMGKAVGKFGVGADRIRLLQDPDVLDTWFSSSLWPFSVMGWPEDTPDMRKFFPGTLLETGHDILFFWVARMTMVSLHLTKQLPFREVYLHAMIRDRNGKKMSKSTGTVIDPLHVMDGVTLEQLNAELHTGNLDPKEISRATNSQRQEFPNGIAACGSDALRFGLLAYTAQGRNINLDVQRIVGYRMFGNKIWNAAKFALLHFQGPLEEKKTLTLFPNQWIWQRLCACADATNAAFEAYDFNAATTAVYDFWLKDFCDFYLEMIKPMLKTKDREETLTTLFSCFRNALCLLHPMMPFLTEELFHFLHFSEDSKTQSIMIQPYPTTEKLQMVFSGGEEVEGKMRLLKSVVHAIRQTRSSLNVTTSSDVHFLASSCAMASGVVELSSHIATLARAPLVHVSFTFSTEVVAAREAKDAVQVPFENDELQIFLVIQATEDAKSKEVERITKKLQATTTILAAQRKKMEMKCYADKTPADIQSQHRDKVAALETQIASWTTTLQNMQAETTQEVVRTTEEKPKDALHPNREYWNTVFASQSYVQGFHATRADSLLVAQMGQVPCEKQFPHLARWYRHILSFSLQVQNQWAE